MLYALDRELLPLLRFGKRTHRRVHFRLDSGHPLADRTTRSWSWSTTRSHSWAAWMSRTRVGTPGAPTDDPRRVDPWGRRYPPYHDVQVMCDGPAAAAIGDLARERWWRAGGACDVRCAPRGAIRGRRA
jgi:phosphatidylserine/phosphatidylglycerophosphate/cardiolipin synthase-like enzyme